MAPRAKMTGWYDPVQLIQTGIRVASATVFGSMFDRRELMASLDDPLNLTEFNANCDFSAAAGDFWFDFCADTGDGWNPAYAVARLLARPNLTVNPWPPTPGAAPVALPQGKVLVLGGDQVYPTPSKQGYDDQLQAPFEAANRFEAKTNKLADRYVFAVPGNHDWYDGLTAFAHLFCNRHPFRPGSATSPGRFVCGRKTQQARTYFALELPHNWWLCAFDIQLDGYIDQTQLSYFGYVAQELMNEGSNIILVAGQPVWAYSRTEVVPEFQNFAFASLVATGAFPRVVGKPTKRHKLRLVPTGDSHHYAHFIQTQPGSAEKTHLLTCGLGGAFLHPTHWLEDTHVTVEWEPPPPFAKKSSGKLPNGRDGYTHDFAIKTDTKQAKVVYPEVNASSRMTWRNLAFAWLNPQFAGFMMVFCLLSTWLLHFGSVVLDTTLADIPRTETLGGAVCKFVELLLVTPWPALLVAGITGALIYFVDYKPWPKRIAMGVAHPLVQTLVYFATLFLITRS